MRKEYRKFTFDMLILQELPPLQELKIDVDPKVVLMKVGAVRSIIGPIGVLTISPFPSSYLLIIPVLNRE